MLGIGDIQAGSPGYFCTQHDIFRNGKSRHQHKMLMDHSNAEVDGIVWIPKNGLVSVHINFTVIRAVQAANNIHQSGFTRPVLTQQNMDFAMAQVEINLAVGRQISEILCNPMKV